MILNGVFRQFAAWFRAGVGVGVMLFVAFTILSALNRGTDEVRGVAVPAFVSQPLTVVQKERKDYRIIREQNRFVADLVDHLSRIVNRVVR